MDMRALLGLLLCATLAACSSGEDLLPPMKAYVPPSMPTMEAAAKGMTQAAAEEKLSGAIEMSGLRPADNGPGHYVMCIRGVDSKYNRLHYYAVFFDNDVYKGARISVIMDDCERQDYREVP